jgi:tetratricopeptide (TPR) repeat protein
VQTQTNQRFSLREAARILEVPEARLRALAREGFLVPQRGPIGPLSFGFQDLILLRTTKGLVESGVSMRRIRKIWASLRKQLAADLPLTSITVHTDGDQVVASDGNASWRPDSGQVLLNFEASEIAERADVPAFQSQAAGADAGADDAQGWYEAGCELEASSPTEASAAYQRALELDPRLADAHINLGRHLHLAGERGKAEAHYREAVRLDPDDPTPHFNLGVLLEELQRKDEAVHAYRQGILRDPDFADAHCNLGLLLESIGRRQEAVRHLMAARKLSAPSE